MSVPARLLSLKWLEFFLYLRQERGFMWLWWKGYRAALNHVFSLTGMDLAASPIVLRMFRSFERSYPPRGDSTSGLGTCLLFCSVCLGLLSSHWSWRLTNTLLGRLHFCLLLRRPKWWVGFTAFPFVFVAYAVGDPVPTIHLFMTLGLRRFTIPSLDDFVDGDRDELLLCPISALRKSVSRTEQDRPGIEGFFISMGMRKKQVSRNTFSFWLRSVISFAHASALEEDCRSLRVRAHEVRKVATSLLFKKNCMVHQVLKAGTWSAQFSFSSFCLRDVTHRYWDAFSIGPVVAAQLIA